MWNFFKCRSKKKEVKAKHTTDILKHAKDKSKGEKDPKDIKQIVTDCSSKCPFCGCTDIRGGSWSPDGCTNCSAVYFSVLGGKNEKESPLSKTK